MIEIYEPGILVGVGRGETFDIEARIEEAIIGENLVIKYKCSWWSGKTLSCGVFCEDEIRMDHGEKVQIGFNRG